MEVHSLTERAILGIDKKFRIISSNYTMQDSLNAERCNNITRYILTEVVGFYQIVTSRVHVLLAEQMVHEVISAILAEPHTNPQN
jgi:hypothetical protein